MNYKKLGKELKKARTESGLSQAQVSKYINKTAQNISSWELGKSKIDIDSFERLCKLYGISFKDTLNSIVDDEDKGLRLSDEEIMRLYSHLKPSLKMLVRRIIYTLSNESF